LNTKSINNRSSLHGYWSSRFSFILAVAGSAVGLGNIWKFPYIAGVNGGGAFVLVYLLCVFLIGLPILVSEILIGRMGRRNPVASMRHLSLESSSLPYWQYVGLAGVLSGILILSFYSVIAGWSLSYIFKSFSHSFIDSTSTLQNPIINNVESIFDNLINDWKIMLFWHTLFLYMTFCVVARGIKGGLEKAIRVLMPLLILLLIGLLFYSIFNGDFIESVYFMFAPKFSELTASGVLIALGHAFFTLSVGMGAIMAYGAYLPSDLSIGKISIAVVFADTLIAIIAGLVIFSVVFANGLDPEQGPGLIFVSLPMAFGSMPFLGNWLGGGFFAGIFFCLLSLAAWTSAISLMEPAVAWLIEKFHIDRFKAALIIFLIIWFVGLGNVFSFNLLSEFTFLQGTIFDNLDYLTSNIMLPIGGLLIVIFAGWIIKEERLSMQLDKSKGFYFKLWLFLSKYIAPAAVLIIFVSSIGILSL